MSIVNKRAVEIASAVRKSRAPVPLVVDMGTTCSMYIYSAIGEAFGGVTAKQVSDELSKSKATCLDVFISSEGGDVFEGKAIYTAISRFPGMKTVHVDGIAASAASVVAMAGDKIVTMPGASWMIHESWSVAMGNAKDLRKLADVLEFENKNIAGIYVSRTHQPEEQIMSWMADEFWFDSQKAVELGFADEVGGMPQEMADPAMPEKKMPKMPMMTPIEIARLRSRVAARK